SHRQSVFVYASLAVPNKLRTFALELNVSCLQCKFNSFWGNFGFLIFLHRLLAAVESHNNFQQHIIIIIFSRLRNDEIMHFYLESLVFKK
ncbi:MAG: hypothetical protein IKQ89_09835, partial [Muribaculaceae bacterium]|nr:hypothetical protein [Muribaculaceae bacterium]